MNFKKIFSKSLLIIFGLGIGLLLSEIILRIYNPLPTRIIGNELRLLTNYQREIDIDESFQKVGLEKTIFYSTNSIGFRGKEPPTSFTKFKAVFTVGGSTTECSLLDDSKTWPYILNNLLSAQIDNLWMNNAGIDGCSTFGHQILLKEHIFKYKPDIILFLVGINEMHVAEYQGDDFLVNFREYRFRSIAQKSELFSFLWNFYRLITIKNYSGHSTLRELDKISKEEFEEKTLFYKNDQKKYYQRLNSIVQECIARKIKPILITQPVFNLTKLHPFSFVRLYNQTTKQVAKKNDIKLIDLASKLESNPQYYYDPVHFTNMGAERVAQIIAIEMLNEYH